MRGSVPAPRAALGCWQPLACSHQLSHVRLRVLRLGSPGLPASPRRLLKPSTRLEQPPGAPAKGSAAASQVVNPGVPLLRWAGADPAAAGN